MMENDIKKLVKKLNILVVDDSILDREIAIAALKKIGVTQVQVAENGSIAASKIENAIAMRTSFDIILTDAKMPSKDGLSLIKWIRDNYKTREQIVIVTTGSAEVETVERFIELGAFGYIVKPLTLDILREKILSALYLMQRKHAS